MVKKKEDMIIENPVVVGEPLKGNWQAFYSCPVKRNFIIIYLSVLRGLPQKGRRFGNDCYYQSIRASGGWPPGMDCAG
ncbi:MAG: hypothetical protein R6V25_14460 [Desulfatiglandales bacterium]